MTDNKKVSDELSTTGQVSPEQLQQAAQAGFKSVLNLRSPSESGFVTDEQLQAQALGLEYANVPVQPSDVDLALIEAALQAIESLPKPILIHCAAGARAGGIALIAHALQEDLKYEQIVVKAQELGINLEQPHLKAYLHIKRSLTHLI